LSIILLTIERAGMSNDTVLNLWRKNLGAVPSSVWDQTSLEVLILANNGLKEISERLGNLSSLRTLDLGHNLLTELPEAIGNLVGLSDFLYLHDNRLTTLPSSMERLQRLRYLNLSENNFLVLPDSIGSLSSLIELRATDLADPLAELMHLTRHAPAAEFAGMRRRKKLSTIRLHRRSWAAKRASRGI
jgi:Leucine-rich repeat (LRR) protein